ncbi:MAG: hypothetical protein ABII18_01840 [bacterium]|nr:hypothetical protein [bacterium]MBU1917569.1 hypothetical protein [bacterium]
MHKFTISKIFIFICLTMFLSTSFVSETNAKTTKLYKTKREYVSLKTKKSDTFEHPSTITKEELENFLQTVKYKQCKFVSWDWKSSKQVFTSRQLDLLANYGSKALAQATDHEYVDFAFTTPSRQFRRYTKGKLFIHNNNLHIIFDRIEEPGADKSPEHYELGEGSWEVVPNGTNQRIQANKYGSKQKNWLVVSLNKKKTDSSIEQ